jgi:hypothetical protein
MNADCFIPGEGNSIDSVRAWARYALAALAGIFLAAGAAPAPSGQSSLGEETASGEKTTKGADRVSIWWQSALYATLLAAMLANRYLRFQNGGTPGSFFTTAYLLQDAIAAFTAFPLVYAKVQLKSDQPIFAQLGVIFTAGMGWQHLVYSVSPR